MVKLEFPTYDYDKTKTAMTGRNSLNLDAFTSRKAFLIDFLPWWLALLKLVTTLGPLLIITDYIYFVFKFLCLRGYVLSVLYRKFESIVSCSLRSIRFKILDFGKFAVLNKFRLFRIDIFWRGRREKLTTDIVFWKKRSAEKKPVNFFTSPLKPHHLC